VDGVGEAAQAVGELALNGALVDVVVPSADVGEGDLDADIGFNELRELLETVAEGLVRIQCTAGGLVGLGVEAFEQVQSLECVLLEAGLVVERLEVVGAIAELKAI